MFGLLSIISRMICETFEKEIGKNQQKNEKQFAIDIHFSLSVDYDKEDGYRWLHLRIFAPRNYVVVLKKESWKIIENEKTNENSEDWKIIADHDSCWRDDGVRRIIREYSNKISHISQLSGWYQKTELSSEKIEEISELRKNR